jgi:hypothetical protein
MYVPPTFRISCNNELKICNLCDEFLHVDQTPEAHLAQHCVQSPCCVRKSVTCVCIVKNERNEKVYGKVYKNELFTSSCLARHAEMFFVSDTELRKILTNGQTITLYLTYQPCHFSGGHYKLSNISCTESLQQFKEKILSPLKIDLKIRFSYLYRAHWETYPYKYRRMIDNANHGLRLLLYSFDVDVLRCNDLKELVDYFDPNTLDQWNRGYFDEILLQRKPLEDFISNYLVHCKLTKHV